MTKFIRKKGSVEATNVAAGKGTSMQVLIGPEEAPNFAFRKFIMEPQGGMPRHKNLVEHEQYVLQGLEPHAVFNGHRAIRLAAERPETIRRVRFELDGQLIDVSHDEPFFCLTETTSLATPWKTDGKPHHWRAIVELADGRSLIRESDCL